MTEQQTVVTRQEQQEAKEQAQESIAAVFDGVHETIASLKSAIRWYRIAGMFKQAEQLEASLKIQRMEAATINFLMSEQVELEQAVTA